MAEILIRGMKMPKSCKECDLFVNCDSCEGWQCLCVILGQIGYYESVPNDCRLESCPLDEIPPHGDLIDRFKLLHPDGDPFNGPMAVTACTIIEQPTVIPATKEMNQHDD